MTPRPRARANSQAELESYLSILRSDGRPLKLRERMYWLVNSGTVEDPWTEDIIERYRAWNATYGDVQMFPFRPRMTVGDRLIHRVVGSPECELVALGEVAAEAKLSGNERWRWAVGRRLLYVCDSLPHAPTADRAGIAAKGMRVAKRLSHDQGRLAESLIVAAGRPFEPA